MERTWSLWSSSGGRWRRLMMPIVVMMVVSVSVVSPASADAFDDGSFESVSVEQLDFHIENGVMTSTVGAAWTIGKDGSRVASGAVGFARRPSDGSVVMSTDTRIDVMSVTKTITAIAVLQLLEEHGLSVDAPIWPWLPASWDVGPYIKPPLRPVPGAQLDPGLTFRELLSHRSGLGQIADGLDEADEDLWNPNGGQDWEALQFVVAGGTIPRIGSTSFRADYSYQNANYSLFRVIIPALWAETSSFPHSTYNLNGPSSVSLYLEYLNENIFAPSGLNQTISCNSPNPALAYPYQYDVEAPGRLVSRTNDCGGWAGLQMSARQLGKVMAHMNHTSVLLSLNNRALMDGARLGWSEGSNGTSDSTRNVYWHSGGYTGPDLERIRTCVMRFPGGVEASLIINSWIGSDIDRSACDVLRDAYASAIYEPPYNPDPVT